MFVGGIVNKFEIQNVEIYGPFSTMWDRYKRIMRAISLADTINGFKEKIKQACPEGNVYYEINKIFVLFEDGAVFLTLMPYYC